MTKNKNQKSWEERMAEFSLKLNSILEMRFGSGTGQDLQVKLAQKEITALIRQTLIRELEGMRMEEKQIYQRDKIARVARQGYNQAVQELNSKLDQRIKELKE